jgi:hypothetical protein
MSENADINPAESRKNKAPTKEQRLEGAKETGVSGFWRRSHNTLNGRAEKFVVYADANSMNRRERNEEMIQAMREIIRRYEEGKLVRVAIYPQMVDPSRPTAPQMKMTFRYEGQGEEEEQEEEEEAEPGLGTLFG